MLASGACTVHRKQRPLSGAFQVDLDPTSMDRQGDSGVEQEQW